ncbi:Hypothetical predicted protein [Xyrichtys novacula]|uniref:Uncharacterized protein n=1 Tax=Xyrichtys novacula TaxID=13765 RepID=A0AAV1GXD5_XYRNO|nr:Hypothetical predicted protein [Xyrichtys novacula]
MLGLLKTQLPLQHSEKKTEKKKKLRAPGGVSVETAPPAHFYKNRQLRATLQSRRLTSCKNACEEFQERGGEDRRNIRVGRVLRGCRQKTPLPRRWQQALVYAISI